uniref:Neurotransmitter-gated ion-channel ligand-binding domain-containing protein n=1 Tax=Knipowitschia caucasica TaxID=637954 RepID=A0AAV2LVD4_KNICA
MGVPRSLLGLALFLCTFKESAQGPNEQRLYEELMRNYSPLVRPVQNDSDTLTVQFGLSLMQIMDVDEKNQVLTTNIWLQMPGETVQSFVLRLRELYCRLRRHDDPPSEAALRDQLLLGLREGPMAQALKVYARWHPDADFAALREEALLLDSEYGSSASEVTCSIVNNKSRFSKEPYSDWKETLKRDIMEEVKAEMKGLAQELIRELKPHLSPVATAAEPPVTPRSYYRSPPRNQRDERGHVRLSGGRAFTVPPNSELLVWGKTRMGPDGADYCALVEALPNAGEVGVARTIGVVRNGRIPIRVCNPHPYGWTIGRYQKLGRLYQIDSADVHGPDDVSLSLEEDGVVEVALVHTTPDPGQHGLPEEVRNLSNRSDLSEQQQEELGALLQKWEKVFAKHDEDFGRTNAVQHRIHTGDSAPTRERYRPLPPSLYKETGLYQPRSSK